jgi:signal transduction histidine kinase
VQSRLLAVITLAIIMGLVFGGLRVADAVSNAEQFGRVSQLARLGEQTVVLTQDLQNERDQTAGVIAGASPATLRAPIAATNAAAVRTRQLAAGIGTGFPANIQSAAAAVASDASFVSLVRGVAQSSGQPTDVISSYANAISDMMQLDDQISQGVSNVGLVNDVSSLNALLQAKDDASQQRALLYDSFTQGFFSEGTGTALNTAIAQEELEENAFGDTATPQQISALSAVLGTAQSGDAGAIEQFMLTDNTPFSDLPSADIAGISSHPAAQWYQLMSVKLDKMQDAELGIAQNIVTQADSVENGAKVSALVTGLLTLGTLLVILAAAVFVARSLVRPLERLRAGALEIATVELPERMRRLSEAVDADADADAGDSADLEVTPIKVASRDEIGQVARAFDQVHREAVRLAGNQAVLRGSFNAMFVNLSRRSQILIERLARQIDSLEQNEEDPERLSELFSMDHLVTRMRRNSENLLLLAGHEGGRRWNEPAPLADVARAAASEIEQYGRVRVRIPAEITIVGQAVADIARLLAELIENATTFSPADTPVRVGAAELRTGGILIEVADAGVGISAERMAELNLRLERPPVVDVQVARHMGLYAVGRLAERYGARVRLRAGNASGTVALVWLPDALIEAAPIIRSPRPGLDRRGRESSPGLSPAYASSPASAPAYTSPSAYAAGSGVNPGAVPAYPPARLAAPSAVTAAPAAAMPPAARHSAGAPAALPARQPGQGSGPGRAGRDPEPGGPGQAGQRAASRWFAAGQQGGAQSQQGTAGSQPGTAQGQPGAVRSQQGDVRGRDGSGPGQMPETRQPSWSPAGVPPAVQEQTSAGLPVRVPRAVQDSQPGRSPGRHSPGRHAATPVSERQRSPERARSTLSGFQRGSRRAKDAGPGAEEGAGR